MRQTGITLRSRPPPPSQPALSVSPPPQAADSEAAKLKEFFSRNTYISGRYADEESFAKLHAHIRTLPGGVDANRLFYMALPPTVYHDVSKNIKHHCMSTKSVHANSSSSSSYLILFCY